MPRFAATLIVVSVILGASRVDAAEPHDQWLRLFKGDWTVEWPGFGFTANSHNRFVADGKAILSRQTSEEGAAIELIAWRSDVRKLVFNGYGAKGNYWHAEYGDLSKEEIKGEIVGVLPDQRVVKGSMTMKRLNDDKLEIHFEGTADGEAVSDVATVIRKKKE